MTANDIYRMVKRRLRGAGLWGFRQFEGVWFSH